MEPITCSYRYASTKTGSALLNCFHRMLHLADRLKEEPGSELICSELEDNLLQVEMLCGSIDALNTEEQYKKQLRNIKATIDEIGETFKEKKSKQNHNLCNVQLPAFLLELREEIYFKGYIRPSPRHMGAYYRHEFARNHANQFIAKGETRYDVSIFVPAKNNLQYSRNCIESIIKNTAPSINYELILLNDGSNDGTQAYFESIPDAKVIHFYENMRIMTFSTAMRVCEGKYAAFINNDTILTKNWLPLLLEAIISDDRVISVSPTTTNVSNYQATRLPTEDLAQIEDFAEMYNHSDASKWEWRARIMPVIALYDMSKINEIGFTDRLFASIEFSDDDFSMRARRAGYKQLLCRNVFCYHFGSKTGGEAQVKENSLGIGRALFLEKNGVDAWSVGAFFDNLVIQLFRKHAAQISGDARILGIDCGFADTLLQMRNELLRRGIGAELHGMTEDIRYVPDQQQVCSRFLFCKSTEDIMRQLATGFGRLQYDCIYIETPLERFNNWKGFLKLCFSRLKKSGIILLSCSNFFTASNYSSFATHSFPEGREVLHFLNPKIVEDYLKVIYDQVDIRPIYTSYAPFACFKNAVVSETVMQSFLITKYQYCCKK